MNENIKGILARLRENLAASCPDAPIGDVLNCNAWHCWADVIDDAAAAAPYIDAKYNPIMRWMAENGESVRAVVDACLWPGGNTVDDVLLLGQMAQHWKAYENLTGCFDDIAYGRALVHLCGIEFDCSDLTDDQVGTLRKYTGTSGIDGMVEITLAVAEDWYNGRLWETF